MLLPVGRLESKKKKNQTKQHWEGMGKWALVHGRWELRYGVAAVARNMLLLKQSDVDLHRTQQFHFWV